MKATKKNLKKIALLELLKQCKACRRKNLIQFLDNQAIDFIGETIHNIFFHANLEFDKKTKSNLKNKYSSKKKVISVLADKSKPIRLRKKLMVQEGGYLSYILQLALPILKV